MPFKHLGMRKPKRGMPILKRERPKKKRGRHRHYYPGRMGAVRKSCHFWPKIRPKIIIKT
jgi:hypothetical protein